METITIVGAGVAGLTAAITCAEAGAPVVLFDAHAAPGGRGRSLDGPYRANLGPHVLYKGPQYRWLDERGLVPPNVGPPVHRHPAALAAASCTARRRSGWSPRC